MEKRIDANTVEPAAAARGAPFDPVDLDLFLYLHAPEFDSLRQAALYKLRGRESINPWSIVMTLIPLGLLALSCSGVLSVPAGAMAISLMVAFIIISSLWQTQRAFRAARPLVADWPNTRAWDGDWLDQLYICLHGRWPSRKRELGFLLAHPKAWPFAVCLGASVFVLWMGPHVAPLASCGLASALSLVGVVGLWRFSQTRDCVIRPTRKHDRRNDRSLTRK